MSEGEVQSTENSETPSLNNEDESQETQVADEVVAKATHQRVLGESRKYKERMVHAEAKIKEIEESSLSEQKKYKELYERAKGDLKVVNESHTKLQLKTQLIPALTKAGCIEVNDAMKLGNTDLLLQDPDDNSLQGVAEYVKDLQQTKPFLFTAGKPSSVNQSLPAPGKVPIAGTETDYSNLSTDEIKKRLKALG